MDVTESIIYALNRDDVNTLESLLKNNADLKLVEALVSPLIISIIRNSQETFDLLIKYGANIHLISQHGQPLNYAITYLRKRMVKKLVDLGADINFNPSLTTVKDLEIDLGVEIYNDTHHVIGINGRVSLGYPALHQAVILSNENYKNSI